MKIKSTYFNKQFDLAKSELVGQGNFAQVYRIYDSELNDFLAIRKVLKNQAEIQDLDKEKQINQQLMKVQNQNILKIFDIIDGKQYIWYITQYCEGGSLWDALNQMKDNKMTQKDAMDCALQVSKGVQQLHNHRITHRDLKPQNILLKTKFVQGKQLPVLKLADFGLSTKKIIMETIAGTKQYIAPQQAKFQNYTNAVDVWSLGIICDQILHGTPYYSGDNNKDVFNKILKLPYKVRDQSIRYSIKELLESLLKKKPYQRPIIAVIRKNIEKIIEQIAIQNPKNNKSKGLKQNEAAKSSGMKKDKFQNNFNIAVGQTKKAQKANESAKKIIANDAEKRDMLNIPTMKQQPNQKSKQRDKIRQRSEQGINLKSNQQVNTHKLRRLDSDQPSLFSPTASSNNKRRNVGRAFQHKKQQKFMNNANNSHSSSKQVNLQSSTSLNNDRLKYSRDRQFLQRTNQQDTKNGKFRDRERQSQKEAPKLEINTDLEQQKSAKLERTPLKSSKKSQTKQQEQLPCEKGAQINVYNLHSNNSNLKYSRALQNNKEPFEKQKPAKTRDLLYSVNNNNNVRKNQPAKQQSENKQTNNAEKNHEKRKYSAQNQELQGKIQGIQHNSNSKSINSHSNTNTNTNPDSEKVVIHKFQKKKALINTMAPKHQQKFDIMDLSTYSLRIVKMKEDILKRRLKFSAQRTFIPNTYLVSIQGPNMTAPDQSFTQFKKKMSFLNYFNTQQQYQIKLHKASQQIEKQKQKTIKEMKQYKQAVKGAFFAQLDWFIDAYIDKLIK